MRIADRYDMARDLQDRYQRAGKHERGEILDAFCLATGYHRKYAIGILTGRQKRTSARKKVVRTRQYGVPFRDALGVAWEASGYVCSERLTPFLKELVPLLEQLMSASAR